jgi:hypothetical protein
MSILGTILAIVVTLDVTPASSTRIEVGKADSFIHKKFDYLIVRVKCTSGSSLANTHVSNLASCRSGLALQDSPWRQGSAKTLPSALVCSRQALTTSTTAPSMCLPMHSPILPMLRMPGNTARNRRQHCKTDRFHGQEARCSEAPLACALGEKIPE